MANPFSGIITNDLKNTHTQMISALLFDDACTVQCELSYEGSKNEDCPNCVQNILMGNSASTYQPGGPIPFSFGECPYCAGRGRIETEQVETIYVMPIWDSKQWVGTEANVNAPNVALQTMTLIANYARIETASTIRMDTAISGYGTQKFMREGDSEPCGFGSSAFIITNWSKVS